ncbi:hypothetical protein [Sporosarcina sp. E16_8]|uniref:hypothetical protein n=1 Tax=Sporosarcina sp. E16_8 TaxID=2789295 RepID=UPI001A9293FD|nr:hypothetical protein [Sporosarcina sp. E16_8]MBO0586137.1 hypothetical protein [Sporosarcina sp. E16_8]
MVKCKRQLRKDRLVILAEIDRLDKFRCIVCEPANGYPDSEKSHCMCQVAIKIRELGKQLYKLTSERKLDESIPTMPEIDKKQDSFEDLTVKLYGKMKAANMSDRAIVKGYGIGSRRLVERKKFHGLSAKTKELAR